VSFVVNCDGQAELDRYWNALLEGGTAEQCGWLKDRFGLSWQIVPTVVGEMMAEPDRAKAKRLSDAMMKMVQDRRRCIASSICGNNGAARAGSLMPEICWPLGSSRYARRHHLHCESWAASCYRDIANTSEAQNG
jgi:3-demethylubiquinone-9 3-methyltransferase